MDAIDISNKNFFTEQVAFGWPEIIIAFFGPNKDYVNVMAYRYKTKIKMPVGKSYKIQPEYLLFFLQLFLPMLLL